MLVHYVRGYRNRQQWNIPLAFASVCDTLGKTGFFASPGMAL
jgi:hypothetical protein